METEIIQLIKDKDFLGLELLINEYGNSIHRTIVSILALPHEHGYQEDVLNEVLYHVWNKIAVYDQSKSSFSTWLLLVTRNKAIDFKRKIAKENHSDFDEEIAGEKKPNPTLEKENFLALIDQLPENDQLIFLYYYFYQFSPEEIGQLLAMKKDQIYNHLSRGRKRLFDILGGQLS